ncbi:TonB-dependent receptor domain-containing protein [Spirosoma utsteinense]|uniref:Outer membrane receptor protein involved in Fe transport n=1 Tax=Spirosoma utsteinense TaxID=2585773 RepID=A0ABR6WAZ2_9BACT|nr:TonB-dependent receptor [Spirosoma utsteinense]MBC3787355.1 outer membrane receptor protein involved in Fe transport [Spirosoma utsteinense]MBC3793091.1 outer membrane receptor protein involved in Fe transport [Spirosoma utsteinense]
MKTLLLSLLIVSATTSFAQFPGGGPPGSGTGERPQRANPATATMPESDPLPRGNGKISGVLIDSTSGKPVEFATVALISAETNKPIDGATSDDKGKFVLNKLAAGKYRLQYSFIGYRDKRTDLITVDRGTDLNLGSVKLAADIRTLSEVNVVGQAAMIEEKVDRLVYNADKDITAKGGDAGDILRKVPMLSVDLDGNVSLRGSSNVRVLINNKPSTIVASSVADALKQIPADMIKTVEVITSPSAKYDAEGSAGIINIVTKKTTLQGATLDVNGGVGNRGSNLGLNGNYRTGKMGFSLSGFGRAEYNVRGAFSNDQTTASPNGNIRTLQTASTLNQRLFGNYQLGWDYDIDKNTSLTASLRYGARNGVTNQNNLLTQTFLPNGFFPIYNDRNVETKDLSGTVDGNITYTRTYKPQQELSVLALYSRNNRTNNFVADILSGADFETITSRQRNENQSYNQESTLQVDYQTPIKTNQLLEFGAKGIFRQVNSEFAYFQADGANSPYIEDDTRPGNTLFYDQNIAASYLSYTLTTKSKFTIKAGARYEYTFINARFSDESTGQTNEAGTNAIPNYGNLVPSINISKNLGSGRIIKLAYNRRIQRPGIQFLNPNVNASNPTNITVGNPYLSPELTDNLEFSTSANIKGLYLNASLFARRTANEITAVRDTATQSFGDIVNPVFQQVIRTNYLNVGRQDAVGLNLFGNGTLFSKWQIGGGIDIYHVSLTNNNANPIYSASNSGWVVSGRLMSSLTLKNGWGVQVFGGARGRQVQLQGYQSSMYFYNVGVRKEFKDKKASIGLAVENFLNHPFVMTSELRSPILSQNTTTSFYNAGVRLTFSYKIGKMSFDAPQKRRRSINNDDVKGGDGGGNDAPQQAAPATGGGGGRPRQ